MIKPVLPMLCLLLIAAGCAPSTKTGDYEIVVKNQTTTPLSVGLIKTGGPIQEHWDAPEQIAVNAPQYAEKHWGTMVPPGESRTLCPQQGEFAEGSVPFVRIYRGDKVINDLVAISRNSPDRAAVALPPGKGVVTVRDERGKLQADYARP